MKIIVGLGNPGLEYQRNRHNIGFRILDEFALAKKGTLKYKGKFDAEIAEIDSYDEPVLLMKPLTFMNRSSKAVMSIIKFFKIDLSQILVIYDDVALPFGTLRFRSQGTSGGHQGIQSIVDDLGSTEFARLRFGVGQVPSDQLKDYVLSNFFPEEEKMLVEWMPICLESLHNYIKFGLDYVMNRYNQKLGDK